MVLTLASTGESLTFQQFTATGDAGAQRTRARLKAVRERNGIPPWILFVQGSESGVGRKERREEV
jgi:hypothetical protein